MHRGHYLVFARQRCLVCVPFKYQPTTRTGTTTTSTIIAVAYTWSFDHQLLFNRQLVVSFFFCTHAYGEVGRVFLSFRRFVLFLFCFVFFNCVFFPFFKCSGSKIICNVVCAVVQLSRVVGSVVGSAGDHVGYIYIGTSRA